MTKAHLFFNETKWDLLEPGDLFIPSGHRHVTKGTLAAAMVADTFGGAKGVLIKTNNTDVVGYGWVIQVHISKAAKRPKVNPISDDKRAERQRKRWAKEDARGRNSKA